jgi:hypothetical protein
MGPTVIDFLLSLPLVSGVVQLLAGALALVAAFGVVCRLDAVSFRTHKLSVVMFHLLLGFVCGLVADRALDGQAGAIDLLSVSVAVLWLWMSYKTWSGGEAPSYTEKANQ